MKIYGDLKSGNCLKVKYTADYLGIAYDWKAIDILQGESRAETFLRRNPQGQVPLIALDDGRYLAQSNAIIRYLASGSALLPGDAYLQAKVDEWLFWEQYSHEPYIAVCRFHMVYKKQSKESREAWRVTRGEQALDTMDNELTTRPWLVGDALSIADIALLAYTRLAPEGGFDLTARPALGEWISRCEGKLSLSADVRT
jgi:glutathione S-transferase